MSPDTVRRSKLTSLGTVDEATALVQRVLPAPALADCREYVSALASLAGAVWQIATRRRCRRSSTPPIPPNGNSPWRLTDVTSSARMAWGR